MKNLFVVLTTLFVFSVIFGFQSCKSTKSTSTISGLTETEQVLPFSSADYQSNSNFLRARASSKSKYDLESAVSEADLLAKGKLASDLEVLVKRVSKSYSNKLQIDDKETFSRNTEDRLVSVTKKNLVNVKTIGEKSIKDKSGTITYWIVKEINLTPIIDESAISISNDEMIKQKYNEAEFKKTFEEEIFKYENEQNK
jgi:hypothetical protein